MGRHVGNAAQFKKANDMKDYRTWWRKEKLDTLDYLVTVLATCDGYCSSPKKAYHIAIILNELLDHICIFYFQDLDNVDCIIEQGWAIREGLA